MKFEMQFSRLLWDAGQASMVMHDFVLVIDPDKIPVAPLRKAGTNKRGLTKALSGAIEIRPRAGRKTLGT